MFISMMHGQTNIRSACLSLIFCELLLGATGFVVGVLHSSCLHLATGLLPYPRVWHWFCRLVVDPTVSLWTKLLKSSTLQEDDCWHCPAHAKPWMPHNSPFDSFDSAAEPDTVPSAVFLRCHIRKFSNVMTGKTVNVSLSTPWRHVGGVDV